MAEPTVFHVDDDSLVRRAVELLLRSVQLPYAGFASAQAFLENIPMARPGCLVVDLRMPGLGGLELIRHCAARGIDMPFIVFSGHTEVGVAVTAMKYGAFDVLEKPASDQILLEAIQSALAQDARFRAEKARHDRVEEALNTLTSAERMVLNQIIEGHSNKGIAARLSVTYKTVEARRARVMEKMGSETLAGLLTSVLAYRLWTEQRTRQRG